MTMQHLAEATSSAELSPPKKPTHPEYLELRTTVRPLCTRVERVTFSMMQVLGEC